MKKTAIVSCYFIHNYGSMLQAYATQKLLDKLNIEKEEKIINTKRLDAEIKKNDDFLKALKELAGKKED